MKFTAITLIVLILSSACITQTSPTLSNPEIPNQTQEPKTEIIATYEELESREDAVEVLINYVIEENPDSTQTLKKFFPYIRTIVTDNGIAFWYENGIGDEEAIDLAADLIILGSFAATSKVEEEWNITHIEFMHYDIATKSSVTFVVDGINDISKISSDPNRVYEIMEPIIDWGNLGTPPPVEVIPPPQDDVNLCPTGCTIQKSGCDIKGNISYNTNEKIYHVPGQNFYNDTKISPEYGERWFCTEDEARANGWRKAKN